MAAEMSEFGIWRLEKPLVLASKSAARRQLLESCGLPFVVHVPEIDEREIEREHLERSGEVVDLPGLLARSKAVSASREVHDAICLGADQVLTLDNDVLHKAATWDEARERLAQLSGRSHRLTSAFALARNGKALAEGQESAELAMRPLGASEIEAYLSLAGAGVLSSVGVYQLEGLGIHLFERITGNHATILGLPLLAVLSALRKQGALWF